MLNDDDRMTFWRPLLNGGNCCDCMSEAEHQRRCEGETSDQDDAVESEQ